MYMKIYVVNITWFRLQIYCLLITTRLIGSLVRANNINLAVQAIIHDQAFPSVDNTLTDWIEQFVCVIYSLT